MEINNKKFEILAPAGDMERLTMALHYGADAVYLAGESFGMRAAASNFNEENLRKAVAMCHAKGVKVNVTCNTLPREYELHALPAYLELLQDVGVDAIICADLGVIAMKNKYAPTPRLHVSTQLGIVNSETCKMVYDLGAKRAVLARECSLKEIKAIRQNIPDDLELEGFCHGAMCVSFSGRCLLSNYMTNRDANRGECAQPCRWKYHLVEEKRPNEYYEISEDNGTYIMNSNDMCMIDHIPEMIDAGITTFKIEGRMKSAYYAAAITNAYAHALKAAVENRPLEQIWIDEVMKVSHRKYCTGFYYGEPGQYYPHNDSIYFATADVCALVTECDDSGYAKLSQRNKFVVGDTLELLTNDGEPIMFTASEMEDDKHRPIDKAPHAMMDLYMRLPKACKPLSIIRKLKNI